MPILLARTTLAPQATQAVTTEGNTNISIHCLVGQVAVEAFADGAASTGYGFIVKGTAVTIPSAAKLLIEATGTISAEVEVHSAT